jgi:hypothetical protein
MVHKINGCLAKSQEVTMTNINKASAMAKCDSPEIREAVKGAIHKITYDKCQINIQGGVIFQVVPSTCR